MIPKLVFSYDITEISYFQQEKGTIPNSSYTTATGPLRFLNDNCYRADASWNVNQYNNVLNVNYIFSVYKNATNVGTIEFTITANQPIDPIKPYIFTLNLYNSTVTAASGIFENYQNAKLVITLNGNVRTISIENCHCLTKNVYYDTLCRL